jgi:hypothetical protein
MLAGFADGLAVVLVVTFIVVGRIARRLEVVLVVVDAVVAAVEVEMIRLIECGVEGTVRPIEITTANERVGALIIQII